MSRWIKQNIAAELETFERTARKTTTDSESYS